MDRFESDLCTYLNAHAAGEFRDPEKITDRWTTDKSIGHVSLLLATLAAGAHYSDLDYPQRLELSIDFGMFGFMQCQAWLTVFSSEIISCSPLGQLSISAITRYYPIAAYLGKYFAKYGTVRCGLGISGYDNSISSDDGPAHRKKYRPLAREREKEGEDSLV